MERNSKETYDRPAYLCIYYNGFAYRLKGHTWFRVGILRDRGKASPIMQQLLTKYASDNEKIDFRKPL